MMLSEWVSLFGVPSVVITDMGAQFVGTCRKTMCSRLGIRRAYSHVYRHQGNGKAERTGKELKDWLSRATDGGRLNWVKILPYVRMKPRGSVATHRTDWFSIVTDTWQGCRMRALRGLRRESGLTG